MPTEASEDPATATEGQQDIAFAFSRFDRGLVGSVYAASRRGEEFIAEQIARGIEPASQFGTGAVALVRWGTENSLYLRLPAQNDLVRLHTFEDPDTFIVDPAWSPDGSVIAFAAYSEPHDPLVDGIYVVPSNGQGGASRIASAERASDLVFAAEEDVLFFNAQKQLVAVNLLDGSTTRIPFSQFAQGDVFGVRPNPALTDLVVYSKDTAEGVWVADALFVAEISEGTERRITPQTIEARHATWHAELGLLFEGKAEGEGNAPYVYRLAELNGEPTRLLEGQDPN